MIHSTSLTAFLLSLWLLFMGNPSDLAQELDGPKHPFNDALLDHMVGNWKLNGNVMGRAADHIVEAEWVLNHQFLRIHEKDNRPASSSVSYEALIFVGYDNTSDRYVAHWNDVYGGRFSETLGYGIRSGDEIRFVFEYPDGPFHTTFRWNPRTQQWKWLMQSKDKSGKWSDFADFTLTRLGPSESVSACPARTQAVESPSNLRYTAVCENGHRFLRRARRN